MQMMHPRKSTIYSECKILERLMKTNHSSKMIEFFNDNNTNPDYLITQNNIFGYDPKNEKILNAFNLFWDLYKTNY